MENINNLPQLPLSPAEQAQQREAINAVFQYHGVEDPSKIGVEITPNGIEMSNEFIINALRAKGVKVPENPSQQWMLLEGSQLIADLLSNAMNQKITVEFPHNG